MFRDLAKAVGQAIGVVGELVTGYHPQESKRSALSSSAIVIKPREIKVDPKNYPLFQLKQAFEAKEFDAKKVMAILREQKFEPTHDGDNLAWVPTIENIAWLPV